MLRLLISPTQPRNMHIRLGPAPNPASEPRPETYPSSSPVLEKLLCQSGLDVQRHKATHTHSHERAGQKQNASTDRDRAARIEQKSQPPGVGSVALIYTELLGNRLSTFLLFNVLPIASMMDAIRDIFTASGIATTHRPAEPPGGQVLPTYFVLRRGRWEDKSHQPS